MSETRKALAKAIKACVRKDCELADCCSLHASHLPDDTFRRWEPAGVGKTCDHFLERKECRR